MAAIFNSAFLNSTILYSAILVFPLKDTHTCQDWSHHLHKKPSLIHSHWTWWWQPSWILPTWIQPLPSWIQTPCYLLSDSLKNTLPLLLLWLKLIHSESNSFIFTYLNDGSHLEFCYLGISSAFWNSVTLFSSLRFTQKHSQSTLTLTQTNSNWLKLIHSHSTWWWQPSWILPSQILTLRCWIQTPCYLLPDSLKNTLPPLWLWP